MAESGRLLGTGAVDADHKCPRLAEAVRHDQPAADGMGRRDWRFSDDRAGARTGEVDGATRLVRGDELAVPTEETYGSARRGGESPAHRLLECVRRRLAVEDTRSFSFVVRS